MAEETLYPRYCALMELVPKDTPPANLAFILDCSIGSIYSLRTYAKYFGKDAEQMREAANKASRESKARKRERERAEKLEREKEMIISHAIGA